MLQCNTIEHIQSMRAALYARVSSENQQQAGTIQSQIEAVVNRVHEDGLTIEAEFRFIDDGHSGATLIRPALEKLRDQAAAGSIDRLYVLCPDRLARSYAYQVLLVDELRRCGVELVFVNRPLNDTPEDSLLLQMQGMISEYERAKLLERCRRGRLHAARRGSVNVLSAAPYGYRYLAASLGGGQAQYNVNLAEAAVVRQIFQWVALERATISHVARTLKTKGILSPRGRDYWDRSTVYCILKNPAYKGTAAFGKSRKGPMRPRLRGARNRPDQPRDGQSLYAQPKEQWIAIAVPAIVDESLFDAVATQLEENRKRSREGLRGARYLLQGLLVCKCCGHAYCGRQPSHAAAEGHRKRSGYYLCLGTDGSRHGGHRICSSKRVREEPLDEAVWNDVRSLLADPRRVESELNRRINGGSQGDGRQTDQKLAVQIDKMRRGIARLIDAYGDGLINKTEFEPRVNAARQQLAHLESQQQSRIDQKEKDRGMRLVIDNLELFSREVQTSLKQADWQTKREIIRTLVKRVELDSEQINIVYRVDIRPFDRSPDRGMRHYCGKRFAATRVPRRMWTHSSSTTSVILRRSTREKFQE